MRASIVYCPYCQRPPPLASGGGLAVMIILQTLCGVLNTNTPPTVYNYSQTVKNESKFITATKTANIPITKNTILSLEDIATRCIVAMPSVPCSMLYIFLFVIIFIIYLIINLCLYYIQEYFLCLWITFYTIDCTYCQ